MILISVSDLADRGGVFPTLYFYDTFSTLVLVLVSLLEEETSVKENFFRRQSTINFTKEINLEQRLLVQYGRNRVGGTPNLVHFGLQW